MRHDDGRRAPGFRAIVPGRSAHLDVSLPPELAFLPQDLADGVTLAETAQEARRTRVCPARLLIATGRLAASTYYEALARHLGLPLVLDWPAISPASDVTNRAGWVELAGASPVRWLVAPEDETLRCLISEHLSGRRWSELAITTPAHLASIMHLRLQDIIEQAATDVLAAGDDRLSAKGVFTPRTALIAMIAFGTLVITWWLARRAVDLSLGLLFLLGISFRLAVCAAGLEPLDETVRWLNDAELPVYTVLVPLRAEADIVPDLVAALENLDYPRAKLEVFILIEPEDLSTRLALAKANLPPWLQVVFGPVGGGLRTKPRALNIGLLAARGALLTVFDAEDRPQANQLRKAAALFSAARDDVACLQASLAIDNGSRSLLARMFALEYATLFDVLNVGTSHLRLPMALGGTSSHFRTAILRKAGGWDAWNVTEDADLGLRLARLGFQVTGMSSTTFEAAPERLGSWLKQRRRWTKGWMQTFIVLLRDAPRLSNQLGALKTVAIVLLLSNLVVGPLLFPLFSAHVVYRFARYGIASPASKMEVVEATLEIVVVALGVVSTLAGGCVGMRVRRLGVFWPSLPLLLPYQLMISAAAWMGLWDLIRRPYHWHKTAHEPHRRDTTPNPPDEEAAARL